VSVHNETLAYRIVWERAESVAMCQAAVDVAAFLADRPNADLRALIKGVGWAKLDLIDWACEQYEPVRQIVEHVEFAADTDQAVECDVRLFNRELLAWLAVHRPALVSCLVASNS
jgi:hypothetical protein